MKTKKKWMQSLDIKEGALRKALKMTGDKKIPAKKLVVKSTDTPLMKKRKVLAKTFAKAKK